MRKTIPESYEIICNKCGWIEVVYDKYTYPNEWSYVELQLNGKSLTWDYCPECTVAVVCAIPGKANEA